MSAELTHRIFKAIDAQDLSIVPEIFAEDASQTFGNADPLVGHDAIVAGSKAFLATVKDLSHRVTREWYAGDDGIVETEVTYHRLDGKSVTLPAVSIYHVRPDGLIDDYRVYFDVAPIYAP